jgi:hypothetical protein
MAIDEGKPKMIAKIKKAVPARTAKSNIEQVKSYRQNSSESNIILKEFLGVLLLRLVSGQAQPDGWELLDGLLRRFYMASGAGFNGLQSTNSAQGVSDRV